MDTVGAEVASSSCVALKWRVAAARHWSSERRYPMSKVRSRSHEETPNTEIQEQWMCFAGLAMRRYPTSKVKETPAR